MYFHFLATVTRKSAALSSYTQYALPPECLMLRICIKRQAIKLDNRCFLLLISYGASRKRNRQNPTFAFRRGEYVEGFATSCRLAEEHQLYARGNRGFEEQHNWGPRKG